jgi:hypothetical protein
MNDVVAGRTAYQIESAKRKAVGGSGRKRCRKGKSCGATCIHSVKVCMVDLPWVSSNGLTKVAKSIVNRKSNGSAKSEMLEMVNLYKEIAKLKDSSLPHVEIDWRVKDVERKIDEVRGRAEGKLQGNGSSLEGLRRAEEKLKIMALGQRELNKRAKRAIVDMMVNRKLYKQRGEDYFLNGFNQASKELRSLLPHIEKGREKDNLIRTYGVITGRIKSADVGSLGETSKAGRDFMKGYKDRLDSALSILRRANLLEEELKRRIANSEGLRLREKMALKKAFYRIQSRGIQADARAQKIMEEMRGELLKTKLSDKEVNELLSRVSVTARNASPGQSTDSAVAQIKGHLEEFARMFNGKGFVEVDKDGVVGFTVRDIAVDVANRAYAQGNFIQTNGNKTVTFHEMGHIVETGRGWLEGHAVQWRDSKAYTLSQLKDDRSHDHYLKGVNGEMIPHAMRTGEDGRSIPVFRLNDMPPNRGRGYDPQEIVVMDKFMAPYMGKVYEGMNASEVISMAMQHFASPGEMRVLYQAHPDLFETIVGMANT